MAAIGFDLWFRFEVTWIYGDELNLRDVHGETCSSTAFFFNETGVDGLGINETGVTALGICNWVSSAIASSI